MCVPVPFAEQLTPGLSCVEAVHGLRPMGPGQTAPASLRGLRVDLSIAVMMSFGLMPRVPDGLRPGLAHCW